MFNPKLLTDMEVMLIMGWRPLPCTALIILNLTRNAQIYSNEVVPSVLSNYMWTRLANKYILTELSVLQTVGGPSTMWIEAGHITGTPSQTFSVPQTCKSTHSNDFANVNKYVYWFVFYITGLGGTSRDIVVLHCRVSRHDGRNWPRLS